ncbi:MAG: imidazole glycerol phosphate synthase subunit HisF, partial [Nitrospina sp.]|nr:imidazole glycerol phosphate synthase subunit HisF [Nitrospina sp.]
ASSNSNLGVVDWAKVAVDAGAGEILLADADNDGSGKGLNVDLARSVAEVVDVPVIISGGCGTAQHFVEGFDIGRAEGIAAGTFFYFRDQNPMETRAHVQNAGIPIRIET